VNKDRLKNTFFKSFQYVLFMLLHVLCGFLPQIADSSKIPIQAHTI